MTVSPEVKLQMYNAALGHLGSRELASLTENREPRRVLDRIWGTDNEVVRYALSRGEWNWALRTIRAEAEMAMEPDFGFKYAFEKPDDVTRLAGLSSDDHFVTRLTNEQYIDEVGFWWADLNVIYVRYVSTDYGMDSSRWGASFRKFIELYMADQACERITNSTAKKDRLQRDAAMLLKEARSSDAMAEGSKQLPHGSWVNSRARQRGSNWW